MGIFSKAYLESNYGYANKKENEDKNKSVLKNIAKVLAIIGAIIASIIIAIIAIPVTAIVSIFINTKSNISEKEKKKELDKYPKAKQAILQAAKKSQDLLKQNFNQKYAVYASITEKDIKFENNYKKDNKKNKTIYIPLGYVDISKLFKDVNGYGIYDSDDWDTDCFSNKQFRDIYFEYVDIIKELNKTKQNVPNNSLLEFYIQDSDWGYSQFLEYEKNYFGIYITFKQYEDLEITQQVRKLKEAVESGIENLSAFIESMYIIY